MNAVKKLGKTYSTCFKCKGTVPKEDLIKGKCETCRKSKEV